MVTLTSCPCDVRVTSPLQSRQPDEDVVTAMAVSWGRSRAWMCRRLSQWSYDHTTATYWLLLAAKRRGEPVRLAAVQVRRRGDRGGGAVMVPERWEDASAVSTHHTRSVPEL